MDFSEYIGFIISFFALAFLLIQRYREERRRKLHPAEYAAEKRKKEEQMKAFLKSLEVSPEEEELPPPPPPRPLKPLLEKKKASPQNPLHDVAKARRIVDDDFAFQSKLETYKPKTAIEQRSFKTKIDDRYTHEQYKDPFGTRIVSIDLQKKQAHDAYEVLNKQTSSRISKLLTGLPSKKDMVLLYEIFGPPGGITTPRN